MNLSVRLCACLAAAALLSGCASFSADGGFSSVQQITKERLAKELHWARTDADQNAIDTRVTALLAQPLSADAAVQLALLNNRGLQASFEDLGIGEAELVQATRLPNPGFSFSRLNRNGELEIERGLHVDLARLLLLPLTGPLERRRFEQTQGMVALSVLTLAADVRRAYFQAVAGQETLRYTRQVRDAAEASAELARRMAQVGNFNKLQRAREQGFYADAMLNVARAEQAAHASRERLTRLLGLWGTQSAFMLPERLPELPKVVMDQPDIERIALAQRLDVQSAKLTAELTAKQLGLTRRTGFINVFELGPRSVSASGATTLRGWEVTVELPLFDWGQAKVARAESTYKQALHRAAETAINARSEVREAYTAYRTAHDIARHHFEEIVPLRKLIADENVLRYNGMLIGVFELLADARLQIASVNAAIEALRDFWLAQAELDMAMIGKPSLSAMSAAPGAAMATDAAAH